MRKNIWEKKRKTETFQLEITFNPFLQSFTCIQSSLCQLLEVVLKYSSFASVKCLMLFVVKEAHSEESLLCCSIFGSICQ